MVPGFVTEAPAEAYQDEPPFYKLELPQILMFICGLFDVTSKVLSFIALAWLTVNIPLANAIMEVPDLSPQKLAEGGDLMARVQFLFLLGAYSLTTLVMMWPTTICLRVFINRKLAWPWWNIVLASLLSFWWVFLYFKTKLYIVFNI